MATWLHIYFVFGLHRLLRGLGSVYGLRGSLWGSGVGWGLAIWDVALDVGIAVGVTDIIKCNV